MVDWSEIEALQAELAAACNEDVAQRLSGFFQKFFSTLNQTKLSSLKLRFESTKKIQKCCKKIVLMKLLILNL